MVVAGGALGGTAQDVLWAAAVLIEWVPPCLRGGPGLRDRARRTSSSATGWSVIVAIGESVVAVGIGAAGLAVNAELVLVAVLGLLLSAGLWWAYFGADDDEQAERALAAAPPRDRPMMALDAFGRAHLLHPARGSCSSRSD